MSLEEKNKVGVILQARMGSSRLPGKVLLPFGKTNLLGWIINRFNNLPWKIVVATSNSDQDKTIVNYCRIDMSAVRKMYLTAIINLPLSLFFDHVIRLTADNSFTDVEELINLVKLHLASRKDYCHNLGKLPGGVGGEIFTNIRLTLN